MKSFKQKQEEKQKHLDAERLILDEKAFMLQQQQESDDIESARLDEIAYNKALLEEQQQQENAIWEERESRKLESEYDLDYQESAERTKQIDDYRKLKNLELEYKSAQKGTINEILSGEDNIRDTISSIERQVELDDYESLQLQKIEQSESLLEQQELELKANRILENKEAVKESAKLARWKENEKLEEAEKQEMADLRELQEKEQRDLEASELQEIISSREIYELRQKEIAKEQLQERIAVNDILKEAQYILDSEKQTHAKDVLSNLHDYIYRLNPDRERDIWTERKQPKAILTWEDWKQVPTNNILIEQDFKRARLLFEQDNQRAQRYADHMFQNFAGRYLTLDRKKAIAADGKLKNIPYDKLVSAREELISDIPNLQVWLDASYKPGFKSVVTESINTASISVSWVPSALLNANTTYFSDNDFYESASLVISGANALFDGDPDTYMSIKHTSTSFDWNDRAIEDINHNYRGTVMIRFSLPEAQYTSSIIDRVELYSTDRKFIPERLSLWMRTNSSVSNHPDRLYYRRSINSVTHSMTGAYNVIGIGSEESSPPAGGPYGITAEGSASLNPYSPVLYPRKRDTSARAAERPDTIGFDNEYVYLIHIAATGSELRFNKFEAFEDMQVQTKINDQDPIYVWKDRRADKGTDPLGAEWIRLATRGGGSRQYPVNGPFYNAGSVGEPTHVTRNGIQEIKMPYVRFSSESISSLRSSKEFIDSSNTTGFTHFFVHRSTATRSPGANKIFHDFGVSYKQQYIVQVAGYNSSLLAMTTDWVQGGTSAETRHQVEIGVGTYDRNNISVDPYGKILFENTASNWPFVKGRWPSEHNLDDSGRLFGNVASGISATETTLLITQLEKPIEQVVSSSRFRMWHKGGTPLVDVDTSATSSYVLTGSSNAGISPPVLGANYVGAEQADIEVHEMLYYNRKLSKAEIQAVSNYLSDKWRLNTLEIKTDAANDFVYELQSGVAGKRKLQFSTQNFDNKNPFSSSLWLLA